MTIKLHKFLALFAMLCVAGTAAPWPLQYAEQTTLEQEGITLTVRKVKKSKNALASKRLMKRYQPIEIEIKNNTPQSHTLIKSGFGLPITPMEGVANKYRSWHASMYPILGWIIGIPVGIALTYGTIRGIITLSRLYKNALLNIISAAIAIPLIAKSPSFFAKVGADSEHGAKRHNDKRRQQLYEYGCDLQNALMIPANETVKKIVYVRRKNFDPSFILTLEETGSNKLTPFKVELQRAN